ncbi:MAG: DUF58 domain-containing protein [Anaerolineae bacterium]|nr:DUF58 domain-containing protein [Anaerolineae bacterium]
MRRAWFFIILGAICVILALTTGRNLFYNLSYLIGVILFLSLFWAWRSVSSVQIARRTRSRRSAVGKTAEESLNVRNTGFLPQVWIEVRDHSTLPWHHISRVVNALPPKRYRNWAVRTICRRRGQFTLGPMTLYSGDPFGLFRFRRELKPTSDIVIYPAVIPIPSFAPPLGQLPGGDAVRGRTHYITTNVAGVRDYAPGDSFSRIHWRSTARTGRLVVKEFELDPSSDIWIFLDMYHRVQCSLPLPEEEPVDPVISILRGRKRPDIELDPMTEEYIVTIAASVTQHFIYKDRAVGMVSYGQTREVMQPDRGHRQLTKILETLAMSRAEGTASLTQVLLTEGDRLGRGVTLVVITPSMDRTWVAASRELMRRGATIIAVVIDPTTFGGSSGDPTEVMAELHASKIPAYLVRNGDDLAVALSRQIVHRSGKRR